MIDPDVEAYNRAMANAMITHIRHQALSDAADLFESINPASDAERLRGDPGAGAMGAVIEYRNKIRELRDGKHEPLDRTHQPESAD